MGSAADDTLAAIDAGLQRSSEDDVVHLDPTKCARCQIREPGEGSDTCGPCRSFLLGDTDVDPKPATNCPVCRFIASLGIEVTQFQVYALHQAALDGLRARMQVQVITAGSGGTLLIGTLSVRPMEEAERPTEWRGLTPSAVWLDEVDWAAWHPPMQHPEGPEDET